MTYEITTIEGDVINIVVVEEGINEEHEEELLLEVWDYYAIAQYFSFSDICRLTKCN